MAQTKIDRHMVMDLKLTCDNDGDAYNQRQSIEKNLVRRMKKGTYDRDKSPKLWGYLVDSCAKNYAKSSFQGKWHRVFNVPTRKAVAAEYADEFERNYSAGEFGAAGASTWVFGGLMAAGLGLVGAAYWLIKKDQ